MLGSSGMLGSELLRRAPAWAQVNAVSHRDVDVCEPGAVARALERTAADVVINATGYTRVDAAERETRLAMALNSTAVGHIARAGLAAGARVVHFSTDYVFSGNAQRPYHESGQTAPVNAYAQSKVSGEEALRASGVPHLLIRTQWLFGIAGQSFPRTMWERATTGKPTRVVNDQLGRPTYAVDLAHATWELVRRGTTDTIHVANAGEASWYDVARRVFDSVGATALLTPCATADYPTEASRPAYSVLDTSRFDALTQATLPHWCDALDRFLIELSTRS